MTSSEKLVFTQTVEALFLRALENRLTPACREHLLRAAMGFRAGNNFSDVEIVERSPTSMELRMNDVLADLPTFAAGLLARAVELCGGWRVVALPEEFDGTAATLHIRWSEVPAEAA